VVAAVTANWLRAYLTVLLGHLSDNRLMGAEDHVVFGWVLFALVLFLLFWGGVRYAELLPIASDSTPARPPSGAVGWVMVLALGGAAIWPALAQHLAADVSGPSSPAPRLVATGAWSEVVQPGASWAPHLIGPRSTTIQRFRKDGAEVAVHIGAFEHQHKGAELASAVNRLVLDLDGTWALAEKRRIAVHAIGLPLEVNAARLRSSRQSLDVWQWMVSGGTPTISLVKGKADVVRARVTGSSDRAFWVAVAVEVDDAAPNRAEQTLREFAVEMGPALAAATGATR
jgi:EpsI family protein